MDLVDELDRTLRTQLARQHIGDMVEEIAVEQTSNFG